MKHRINVLDEAIYKRIAAGEVVVNPASVVKELVENSMDAEATAITIEIAQGGKELIRVTDNGVGIIAEDVPLAVQKHATSKIRSLSDLEQIETLGFRGEALSSMAAVSRLTIKTRPHDSVEGTILSVSGEHRPEVSSAGLAEGTTVRVENLFYNIPARMKFLKNTARETVNVTSVVSRLIFANPHIAIKYINNGKVIYHSPGNGSLKDAVIAVYGKDISHRLIDLEYPGEIAIHGLISRPDFLYKGTNHICFFLNSRYIQSRNLQAAVLREYGERLLRGHFPFSVLHVTLPPDRADVNVHPGKLQVMLYDEADVLSAAEHAVRAALEEDSKPPVLSLQDIPPASSGSPSAPSVSKDSKDPSFHHYPQLRSAEKLYRNDWKTAAQESGYIRTETSSAYGGTFTPNQDFKEMIHSVAEYHAPVSEQEMIEDVRRLLDYRIIGQIWNTYIIIECADLLYLIDQHAAHERINFERMKKAAAGGTVAAQGLLVPYITTLTAEEFSLLMKNKDLLSSLGFELEEFGPLTLKFSSFPAQIEKSSAEQLIEEILFELKNTRGDILLQREAVIRASCRYSIKAGYELSDEQIEELMKEITELDAIPNCPHGRPIAIVLQKSDLQKGFKRTV